MAWARKNRGPSRTTQDQAAENADDLELEAMRNGFAPFDRGLFDDRVAGRIEEDYPVPESQPLPEWASRDESLDFGVAAQVDELHRRKQLLGGCYPFEIKDGFLKYTGSKTLTYEFCLCICNARSITVGKWVTLPRTFERLVGKAVAVFLGPRGEWYRSGWPPDGDRPERIKDTVDHLHQRTREWIWGALPELGSDPGPRTVKDGGIDLVVWRPFGDDRVGSLFLLGQCACGNDWGTKLSDLKPQVFEDKWLRKMTYCGQLRFMAIPHHVPALEQWSSCCLEAGILLDRIRLTLLAEEHDTAFNASPASSVDLLELIRFVVPEFALLN